MTIHKINTAVLSFAAAYIICLTSCSDDDYLNAIPAESTALVSIDVTKAAEQTQGKTNAGILKALFHVSDISDCGIDITSNIYLFESPDGNLGMAAKVKDGKDIDKWLNKLTKYGICPKTQERRGAHFTVLKQSWVVGFNDKALLVMGPAISSAQPELMRRMMKYLDSDEGIKGTPMYDKLDSIDAPIALVAQVAALPEKFSMPFMLGAPKEADMSQVVVAAGMNVADGCLKINGETFSYHKQIDQAIKMSHKVFRPIKGQYAGCMSKDAAVTAFMNVEGNKFIDILHANKGFQALLAGINTAIDMDNIIKSIDGDMAIAINGYGKEMPDIQMAAQLGKRDFLSDVGYWKESCPAGSKIADWEKDSYHYTGNSVNYYFGVSEDNQFYSGSTADKAKASITASPTPYSTAIQDGVKGKRICVVVSLRTLLGGNSQAEIIKTFLYPLFGNIETVVLEL